MEMSEDERNAAIRDARKALMEEMNSGRLTKNSS